MDPKALLLLPGLVATQHHDSKKTPTVFSLKASATPVYVWPEREREPLEGDHPGHGEGSDESVMFVGISSNVSNVSARVTIDSGASGIGPYMSAGWLPKGLNLVTSFDELEIGERVPAPLPYATNLISPNASKHLTNRTTIQTRRAFSRPKR